MSHSQPHAGESSSWVSRLNLSQWALDHQAFTRYLMIVLMLLGVAAYFQLGQDEDPPFTFRAMVVRAFWPGATAQQVSEQVADRIEKTLQEVPYADKIRSYSKPGETLILFQVRDNAPSSEIPQAWYTVRKKVGDMRATLPQGVVGPFFNDEFGDVFGVIYALAGRGLHTGERKRLADDVRQKLLRVKDVNKVELFGAQEEKLFIESRTSGWPPSGWTCSRCWRRSGSRTPSNPPAPCRRRTTWFRCGWPGPLIRWSSCARCRSGPPTAPSCGWATSPASAWTTSTRRRCWCATTAATASRWAFRCPRAATSSRWARPCRRRWPTSAATCPPAWSWCRCRTSPARSAARSTSL